MIKKLAENKTIILTALLIFCLALICRIFTQQDLVNEVKTFQYGLFEAYSLTAKILNEDGWLSLFDAQSRAANIDFLGHPIGYPLYLAAIYRIFGEAESTVQYFSIFFDTLSAVLIYLIGTKLFSQKTGVIAGIFAALSSALTVNSVLLLPDTLAVFPILAAVYFSVCAERKPLYRYFIVAGLSLGVSCWFRSNSFFLPIFAAAMIFLIFDKQHRLKFAGAILLSAYLTVLPLTLRNFIVYREFIPISLGAGQTLLEGIGDYDSAKIYGVPNSDYEISHTEAVKFNRPDYADTLFGADGIERDRRRIREAANFIGEHPFWFAKTYLRRAVSMLNIPKPQPISGVIPVAHSLDEINSENIIWQQNAAQILENGEKLSAEAVISENSSNQSFVLQTDQTRFDDQFKLVTMNLPAQQDFALDFEYLIDKGRVSVKIIGVDSLTKYAATDLQFDIYDKNAPQNIQRLKIPFVLNQNEAVNIIISNASAEDNASILEVKNFQLHALGASRFNGLRYLRLILGFAQKPLTTAVFAPFVLYGIFLLRRRKILLLLVFVPLYYLSVQSFFHTEPRYVLAIHYFTFLLAAFGLVSLFTATKHFLKRKRGE